MTRYFDRDALGHLPVIEAGEAPCRYDSARGWHVEWYPAPRSPARPRRTTDSA